MTNPTRDWRADERHAHALDLLPWHLAGSLEGEEAAQVEAHLAACAQCRGELEQERRLKAALAELPVDVERGWARLNARIGGQRRATAARRATPRGERVGSARGWLAAASAGGVAAGIALTLGISADGRLPSRVQTYHALAAAPLPTLRIAVMFRPETNEGDLRRLLATAGARVVDGPTAAGGWVLATTPAARPAALARLRADRAVSLAEPIDGPGR